MRLSITIILVTLGLGIIISAYFVSIEIGNIFIGYIGFLVGIVILLYLPRKVNKQAIETLKSRLPKDEIARYKKLVNNERKKKLVHDMYPVGIETYTPKIKKCSVCDTAISDEWSVCKGCGSELKNY